jgi:RecB family exonuclease/inactivated superfamily I helicase
VITPRRTRLLRVPDIHAFRSTIAAHPARINGLIVVPTRSAALQLDDAPAVTRDELYDRLHGRLSNPPRRLSSIEREVIAQAAARAAASDRTLAFRLRPGLVAELLRFYDLLRRQSQQVQRFEELISDALGPSDIDRGAQRMREQTHFLADAFREYERRVRESGAVDEHLLRERLITEAALEPLTAVLITVADWIADADGLFVADFELLSRIPGLTSLDIVATQRVLGSGLHQRLHNWLPGIQESKVESRTLKVESRASQVESRLVVPDGAPPDEPWWVHRDREEELIAVVQQIEDNRRTGDAVALERVAVVFKQPLPYLYVAREVFGAAAVPYRTFDALPLAGEPTAAAMDLLLEAVDANFTRDSLISLLRSPHFAFQVDGAALSREAISALDRALSIARYLGDVPKLEAAVAGIAGVAVRAATAVLQLARELAPLRELAPASVHLQRLLSLWHKYLAPLVDEGSIESREQSARAAITGTIQSLAAVHAAYDDPEWTIEDLSLAIRRAIEDQTFHIPTGERGVRLLDDKAARYGEFDDVTVVGLVDSEWPERSRRNIFYPPALLKALGWPSEKDRRGAADAYLLDLLGSAMRRTTLSLFTLEDDALVARSLQLDDVMHSRQSQVAIRKSTAASQPSAFVTRDSGTWAALRAERTSAIENRFHGVAGAAPPRVWSVSALETYLGCPFRFFAQHVLKLEEEPEDEEVMDPRRQGQFVHEVFEQFFAAWQAAGHRAIALNNLGAARELFAEVVERALAKLPDAEAGLERTRLLGSPAAAGLGEAVFRMEAERTTPVSERLLEHRLEGEFSFATPAGPRTATVRGKADRLDLLADGTFRLIDYKLGWPPDRRKALQLPIYSVCAEQTLRTYRGRSWTLGEATYLAFKGPRRVVPLFTSPADREKVLADAQDRLVSTIDAINAGQFPPTPDDVFRCETCSYAAVCRKDYVGDV